MLSRRRFLRLSSCLPLGAALSSSLTSTQARAIGPRSELSIGVVRHGAAWDDRPEAVRRLLWEAAKRTSILTARERVVVSLDDDGSAEARALFWQPMLVWSGAGELPPLSNAARARLAHHLRAGGMLLVDGASSDDAFLVGAKRELGAVLPGLVPRPLGDDHVVYKSFFLLERATGRFQHGDRLEGIDVSGRTAVFFSDNDLLGAMERDRFGTWRFECEPDGESQRERAFRLGVNLLMYATCLDYKADQVHIPFIMKKKRR